MFLTKSSKTSILIDFFLI